MPAPRASRLLLLLLAAAAAPLPAAARAPVMGWSTWNAYGCRINETVLAATADAMASLGLVAAGFTGLHIDDCWSSGRTPAGDLIPDPSVFPSGFQRTVDAIHSAGMQLGMYTARGAITCENRPGVLGHEAQDAAFFLSHSVTYLKFDSCGQYGNRTAF